MKGFFTLRVILRCTARVRIKGSADQGADQGFCGSELGPGPGKRSVRVRIRARVRIGVGLR